MEFTNGVAKFRLGGSQTRKAEGLPTGITYTVKEDGATGFSTTGKIDAGNETAAANNEFSGTITTTPSKVEITNKRDEGNLTVRKVVDSQLANEKAPVNSRPSFEFTVTLEKSISGTFGGMSFKDGVSSFTLRDGESKSATGLPADVKYTVTEKSNNNFITTWSGNTSLNGNAGTETAGKQAGTIVKGETDTITATNTHKSGELSLKKILRSNTESDLTTKEFTFTVTLSDKTISSSGNQ